MLGLNLIVIYHRDGTRMLMCRRKKDPYLGLCNFVGGKIEPGEDHLDAAYRELFEETAITREDTQLTHLMDFTYYLSDCCIEVYVGTLNKEVAVAGDENELYWSGLDENFFDSGKFAAEGSLGHIVEQIKLNRARQRL